MWVLQRFYYLRLVYEGLIVFVRGLLYRNDLGCERFTIRNPLNQIDFSSCALPKLLYYLKFFLETDFAELSPEYFLDTGELCCFGHEEFEF